MPVILGRVRQANPDIDMSTIVSSVTDEQLLSLANQASLFISEANDAGIDLNRWRETVEPSKDETETPLEQHVVCASPQPTEDGEIYADTSVAPASSSATGAPSSTLGGDNMDVEDGEIHPQAPPATAPPASTSQPGVQSIPEGIVVNDGTEAQDEAQASAEPTVESIEYKARLPTVIRTLCVIPGSAEMKTVAMPFTVSDTERANIARWSLRHEDLE